MTNFITIQPAFFCEGCKECGARPVVEQIKGTFLIRCPNDKKHYKTKPGFFEQNLQEWNIKNRANVPTMGKQPPEQKAS